ncbi:hypothetical protein [Methylomonas koyamae]|uniref:Uncharacterized protein n=1 Tax=Methylomonas koyamae TaxID=702114 RepID=A0AA91I4Q0_9GAMM|nr:hypothetical protein [Methylomonas koyamae]OAI24738.1 hypothetical protein A1356_15105 [Methylomonas koyamae]
MNENFASEPNCCENMHEFRHFLERFGPYAGRYLIAYPKDWFKEVEAHIGSWGELDQVRAKTLLRRARENAAILTKPNLIWDGSKSWFDNAVERAVERDFDGIIIARRSDSLSRGNAHTCDDLEWPPTAEERIIAIPEEYVRVSRFLLLISYELFFIDPYLNPCKQSISSVIEKMLQVVAKGKCHRLVFWSRTSNIIDTRNGITLDDVENKLRKIISEIEFKHDFKLEFLLVDDDRSRERMHGRYLLSIKGGLRLDQGFQQLSKGRKVEVGPVGRATHEELIRIFLDGAHDIQIDHRININVG